MRLWAEERKQGTIELLMTLPVTLPQLVVAKFLRRVCASRQSRLLLTLGARCGFKTVN
jgi:ABC-type transport system involved in cytochrome c biogenesis permease component